MALDKTFVNGGSLLPGDLNKIQEDFNGAYLYKKVLREASARLDAPSSGGPYLLGAGSTGVGVAAAGATAGLSVFHLDPADYKQSEVNERTVKYNLAVTLLANAVAPGITFTVGMYPVSGVAGAEAALTVTLGSVVAGSTAAFTTPAKETSSFVASTLFTAPAAGNYVLASAVSGSSAAKSSVAIRAVIQMSQV